MCICRTTSGMVSSAASGGRITMSTPSPSTFSSESVTSAATSMSASSVSESPVISQSIHTMRSFMRLTLRGAPLAGQGRAALARTPPELGLDAAPRDRPERRRGTGTGAADGRRGCSGRPAAVPWRRARTCSIAAATRSSAPPCGRRAR